MATVSPPIRWALVKGGQEGWAMREVPAGEAGP